MRIWKVKSGWGDRLVSAWTAKEAIKEFSRSLWDDKVHVARGAQDGIESDWRAWFEDSIEFMESYGIVSQSLKE